MELFTARQVCARYRFGMTTLYRRLQAGTFPRPMQLSARMVRWRAVDLEAWEQGLQPTAPSVGLGGPERRRSRRPATYPPASS